MALLGASEARIRYSAENLDFKSLSTARRTAGSSSNARIKGFLAITSPCCRQRRTQRLSGFDARTGQCDTTKTKLDGSGTPEHSFRGVPYAIGYRSTDHRCPRPTLSPVPFEVHRGRAGEMIDGAHDQSRRIR